MSCSHFRAITSIFFIQESIKLILKKIDGELIAEQVKLLRDEDDSEQWFEGEFNDWQEKY